MAVAENCTVEFFTIEGFDGELKPRQKVKVKALSSKGEKRFRVLVRIFQNVFYKIVFVFVIIVYCNYGTFRIGFIFEGWQEFHCRAIIEILPY